MALIRQLWSLNALALELAIDRRTLGRRLDGLKPAAINHQPGLFPDSGDQTTLNRYYLSDVLEHLRHAPPIPDDGFFIGFWIKLLERSLEAAAGMAAEAGVPPRFAWDVLGCFMMVQKLIIEKMLELEEEALEELPQSALLQKVATPQGRAALAKATAARMDARPKRRKKKAAKIMEVSPMARIPL